MDIHSFNKKKELYFSFERPIINSKMNSDRQMLVSEETSFCESSRLVNITNNKNNNLNEKLPSHWPDFLKVYFRFPRNKKEYFSIIKGLFSLFLFLIILATCVVLVIFAEKNEINYIVAVQNGESHYTEIKYRVSADDYFIAELTGPFDKECQCQTCSSDINSYAENRSDCLIIEIQREQLLNTTKICLLLEQGYNNSWTEEDSASTKQFVFQTPLSQKVEVEFSTTANYIVAFNARLYSVHFYSNFEVLIAALILCFVYVLIIFEFVHRTVAAIIGSTVSIGVLAILGQRPPLEEIIGWIDYETVCLLFGMMLIVGMISETGFFDYLAIKAYRISRGKIWPLIFILCFFAGVVSAFLDNVTTILLLTPVTIRLCQILNVDPRPVLLAEVMFSNIGGTATAIGDPPNVIIVSNKEIKQHGINFINFTVHMSVGIFFCMLLAFLFLRLLYWKIQLKNVEATKILELKREKQIWERAARRVGGTTLEENEVRKLLLQKANDVQCLIKQEMFGISHANQWKETIKQLEDRYRITDGALLAKSAIVLGLVIILFFAGSSEKVNLDLGWTSMIGAIMLIVWSGIKDFEHILEKVEWATLIFFAALFVLMNALEELGLIAYIGDVTKLLVDMVPIEHRLTVAIIVILWVSALASSFIDNIPFTTAMMGVILRMAEGESGSQDDLPIKPLIWALAFGACLGGNGTLIGASANVVCVGIAEQNGYKISFLQFFKVGFPMMLFTTFIAMIYLVICHSAIQWNYY